MSSAVKQHLADAKTAGFERHLYYRDGDTRPALRGQFFASFKWEWTTFVTLYLVATSMVSASINYPLKARNKVVMPHTLLLPSAPICPSSFFLPPPLYLCCR